MTALAKKVQLSPKLVDPEDMTPEQISTALKNAEVIEIWIRAVRAHAFAELSEGRKIPGYGLGYGVRHRIWKTGISSEVISDLHALGIPREDIYHPEELKTPAQIEKVLKEHKKWPRKPPHGERPPTPIDPYVEKSMPEKKLMKMDDDRVVMDAEEEFGNE